MKVKINQIPKEIAENIQINCHEVHDGIQEIVNFIKSRQGQLTCSLEGRQYEIPVADILYIESVDNHTFVYLNNKTYETRQKLYELEESLKGSHFLRISKSCLVNLMKIKAIKPALNGRFLAILSNNEQVIISRKYVPQFKKTLKGAAGNE